MDCPPATRYLVSCQSQPELLSQMIHSQRHSVPLMTVLHTRTYKSQENPSIRRTALHRNDQSPNSTNMYRRTRDKKHKHDAHPSRQTASSRAHHRNTRLSTPKGKIAWYSGNSETGSKPVSVRTRAPSEQVFTIQKVRGGGGGGWKIKDEGSGRKSISYEYRAKKPQGPMTWQNNYEDVRQEEKEVETE